jgi:hypothetical protein
MPTFVVGLGQDRHQALRFRDEHPLSGVSWSRFKAEAGPTEIYCPDSCAAASIERPIDMFDRCKVELLV